MPDYRTASRQGCMGNYSEQCCISIYYEPSANGIPSSPAHPIRPPHSTWIPATHPVRDTCSGNLIPCTCPNLQTTQQSSPGPPSGGPERPAHPAGQLPLRAGGQAGRPSPNSNDERENPVYEGTFGCRQRACLQSASAIPIAIAESWRAIGRGSGTAAGPLHYLPGFSTIATRGGSDRRAHTQARKYRASTARRAGRRLLLRPCADTFDCFSALAQPATKLPFQRANGQTKGGPLQRLDCGGLRITVGMSLLHTWCYGRLRRSSANAAGTHQCRGGHNHVIVQDDQRIGRVGESSAICPGGPTSPVDCGSKH
jgi:hypothetical protein